MSSILRAAGRSELSCSSMDIFKRNRASFHWWLPSGNLKVRIGAQKQEIGAS
jgi:hypothetical protein